MVLEQYIAIQPKIDRGGIYIYIKSMQKLTCQYLVFGGELYQQNIQCMNVMLD